jgi:DNA-binding transcriptional ArsR family regulator
MASQEDHEKPRPDPAPTGQETSRPAQATSGWTFLSNHSHVLICLYRDPDLTLREVAFQVGITERSVQRILSELEGAGYLERERVGLRNRYRFKTEAPLRHPVEAHCRIGDLIRLVDKERI